MRLSICLVDASAVPRACARHFAEGPWRYAADTDDDELAKARFILAKALVAADRDRERAVALARGALETLQTTEPTDPLIEELEDCRQRIP